MRHIKLHEPPRARLRVRDIAKEIDVSAREVLAVLNDINEYVKNSASFVEAPIIRRVHEIFGVTDGPPPSPGWPDRLPTPHSPTGLTPPPKRRKRDNHPLMGEISPRRDGNAHPDSGSTESASTASWAGRKADQQWAELAGGDASHSFEFEGWKLYGFSEVERDVWIAAGLRPGQARHAAELRDAGLSSTDLSIDLNGWTVADRLQRGEGAVAVARTLTHMRSREAG